MVQNVQPDDLDLNKLLRQKLNGIQLKQETNPDNHLDKLPLLRYQWKNWGTTGKKKTRSPPNDAEISEQKPPGKITREMSETDINEINQTPLPPHDPPRATNASLPPGEICDPRLYDAGGFMKWNETLDARCA